MIDEMTVLVFCNQNIQHNINIFKFRTIMYRRLGLFRHSEVKWVCTWTKNNNRKALKSVLGLIRV